MTSTRQAAVAACFMIFGPLAGILLAAIGSNFVSTNIAGQLGGWSLLLGCVLGALGALGLPGAIWLRVLLATCYLPAALLFFGLAMNAVATIVDEF